MPVGIGHGEEALVAQLVHVDVAVGLLLRLEEILVCGQPSLLGVGVKSREQCVLAYNDAIDDDDFLCG